MSIEVRVSTSVSPLWTYIKVLSEHMLCTENTERIIFFNIVFISSLFMSLSRTLCILSSFPLNLPSVFLMLSG